MDKISLNVILAFYNDMVKTRPPAAIHSNRGYNFSLGAALAISGLAYRSELTRSELFSSDALNHMNMPSSHHPHHLR